jgi:hypothetical protein
MEYGKVLAVGPPHGGRRVGMTTLVIRGRAARTPLPLCAQIIIWFPVSLECFILHRVGLTILGRPLSRVRDAMSSHPPRLVSYLECQSDSSQNLLRVRDRARRGGMTPQGPPQGGPFHFLIPLCR